jgi:hypothetical protein
MWRCTKCGAKVDRGFEICWRCGTSSDGIEDPHFGKITPEDDLAAAPEVPSDLVTVATFSAAPEAHAVRMRLEAAGITVYLADEFTVTMDWLLSNAIGGVKVQVSARDAERALQILAEKPKRRSRRSKEDAREPREAIQKIYKRFLRRMEGPFQGPKEPPSDSERA